MPKYHPFTHSAAYWWSLVEFFAVTKRPASALADSHTPAKCLLKPSNKLLGSIRGDIHDYDMD